MNSPEQNKEFNPSGVGLKNGNFIGLPFTEDSANVILIPVPWDVTVSSRQGTAHGPQAILDASVQLDLYDPDVEDAWKLGIFMPPADESVLRKRNELRPKAAGYIGFLEEGGNLQGFPRMKKVLREINDACGQMNQWVYHQTKKRLDAGKLTGVVGGDHSVPLGFLKALGEKFHDFGVLQLDAHFDLRENYERFTFSHASVFFNALKDKAVSKLVQVGIRDFCEEELKKVKEEGDRVVVFFDHTLKENRFCGMDWNTQCNEIANKLPRDVYISFDIDGLDPKLCPNTGTPVPGGLGFAEGIFLIKKLVESGRRIIGFDLCETGNSEWDANVGARLLYKMSNMTGRSRGII
jgi:agmatinase